MSLDCIERTDKLRVYPWIIIDLDNNNKEISCGKTCEEAWCCAAAELDNKLFALRKAFKDIDNQD